MALTGAERQRRYRARIGAQAQRSAKLRWNYGLTVEEVERMRQQQSGLCAMCGVEGELVIDHDHRSGQVRGLLCTPCNLTLGTAQDRVEVLVSAARYLAVLV